MEIIHDQEPSGREEFDIGNLLLWADSEEMSEITFLLLEENGEDSDEESGSDEEEKKYTEKTTKEHRRKKNEDYRESFEDARKINEMVDLYGWFGEDAYLKPENRDNKHEDGVEKKQTAVNELSFYHESGITEFGSLYMEEKPQVLKLRYDDPIFINNQWTQERIFIENRKDNTSLYEAIMQSFDPSDVSVKYDENFGNLYLQSIGEAQDGKGGFYLEHWINGQIGEKSIENERLRKGDLVEIRYSEERQFGCGGGYSRQERNNFTPVDKELKRMIYNSRNLLDSSYLSTFGRLY